MTRTRFIALFLAGVLIIAVAACTPDPGDDDGEAEGEVELVWAIGGQPDIHQQVVDMWNEENPDIQVRIETLPEDADEQRVQQTLVLDAAGADFDILAVDVMWTGEYAENDWIVNWEEQRGDLEGTTLEGPLHSAMWQGELWAAPYNSNAGFLYYRTDLIDEPPTTWEELREVGLEAAEEEGIAAYVGQGARYEGFVVNFLEYYWSAGGELLDEEQTESLWDDDAAMTAIEFMRESFEEGFYSPGFNTSMEEEARSEFQEGNAVFMRNWPYAYELITEDDDSPIREDFDIAPLPTFDGDGTISALGGYNNAVSAFSEHEEEAREFVLWVSTNEELQTFIGESALPPVMEQVYEDLADDPVMALLGEVLPDAVPRPAIPQWPEISDVIAREMFAAYNGDAEPQAAVDAVGEHLQGIVE